MSDDLPMRGWLGYGAPGHRYSMAYQVAADLRKSALQADDWGHELREIALDNWLRDHPAIADDVCLAIACIGMRGDAQ